MDRYFKIVFVLKMDFLLTCILFAMCIKLKEGIMIQLLKEISFTINHSKNALKEVNEENLEASRIDLLQNDVSQIILEVPTN